MLRHERKKILVTGGSGFLGSHLVHAALTPGRFFEVHYTHLGETYLPLGRPEAAHDYLLDIREEKEVMSLAGTPWDIVVHTAAMTSATEDSLEMLRAVNVHGSWNVAGLARKTGAYLIHISSDVVYPGEKGPYTEEDEPGPLNPYAESKLESERPAVKLHDDAVVLRPSIMFPLQYHEPTRCPTERMLERIKSGERADLFTNQIRSPVWVRSVAEAILEICDMRRKPSGIFNLSGDEALSRFQFGIKLAQFLGLDTANVVEGEYHHGLLPLKYPIDCSMSNAKAQALLKTKLCGPTSAIEAARAGLSDIP